VTVGQQLRVGVRSNDDRAVVHLDGELDLASAPLLEREIGSPEVRAAKRLVIDLRGLRFVDSTGLRTIFGAHARARERGQKFAVTRGSEQVQRVLAITRLGEHLPVIDSPEQMPA
jgi:anti-sigma B factor antagonist